MIVIVHDMVIGGPKTAYWALGKGRISEWPQ